MIPLRRRDRRVEKSPFLAAISASSRSSSCSSETVPLGLFTGAPLAAEGCEVARRGAAVAAVVVLRDFERASGTGLPLLAGYNESFRGGERYAHAGGGATGLGF